MSSSPVPCERRAQPGILNSLTLGRHGAKYVKLHAWVEVGDYSWAARAHGEMKKWESIDDKLVE
jgi:hypothetical protein